jgi:hypothetical protein
VKLFVLTGIVALGLASSVSAQSSTEMDMAYTSGRNQLGVLKYCQGKGYIDGEAATIQVKLLALVAAPADKTAGDEAEKTGVNGTMSMMGMEQNIAETAKAQNISEKQLCESIADATKQVGAEMPK